MNTYTDSDTITRRTLLGLCASAAATTAFSGFAATSAMADESASNGGLDGFIDWISSENVFHTVKTFSDDEADKPTDDELTAIMRVGSLASSTMGSQPWYFVAIPGYDEQQSFAPSYTTHGTATILCCTTDSVMETLATLTADDTQNMGLWKLFDLGDAAGYMCLAAMSLGYRVHLETSGLHGMGGGMGHDEICAKFVAGTYYPSGMGADTTPQDAAEVCDNIVAALHIGKPSADEQVDAVSGATTSERQQNYAIWSEDLAFEG